MTNVFLTSFSLAKFTGFLDGMYIFSSGGEVSDSYGTYMRVTGGQFEIGLKTQTHQWRVFLPFFKLRVWMK